MVRRGADDICAAAEGGGKFGRQVEKYSVVSHKLIPTLGTVCHHIRHSGSAFEPESRSFEITKNLRDATLLGTSLTFMDMSLYSNCHGGLQ